MCDVRRVARGDEPAENYRPTPRLTLSPYRFPFFFFLTFKAAELFYSDARLTV